jgi:quinol monooxygenase YgiN
MSSNTVSIHPYFEVKEGKMDAFREIAAKLVELCSAEPKCVSFGFSFKDNTVFCRESYEGAQGVFEHLDNAGAMIGDVFECADLKRIEIHGPAEDLEKLKEPLKDLNPDYYTLEFGQ